MTHPPTSRLPLFTLALLVVALVPTWALSPVRADTGKGHTAVATRAVNTTLARAGIRSAHVSTRITSLAASTRGNRITVRCSVQVNVASRDGKQIGPGQTATIVGNGRITTRGRGKRAARAAKRSCVSEVATELARRKVTPFIGHPRVSKR